MTKTKYSAKLSNGHVVTRKSNRAYTHFWRSWGRAESSGYSGGDAGFAGSLALAQKAVAATEARIRRHAGPDAQINSEIVEAQADNEKPGRDLEFSAENQAAAWSAA